MAPREKVRQLLAGSGVAKIELAAYALTAEEIAGGTAIAEGVPYTIDEEDTAAAAADDDAGIAGTGVGPLNPDGRAFAELRGSRCRVG